MTISFVGAGPAVTTAPPSNVQLQSPVIQAGDFLIAIVPHAAAATPTSTITPPAGWSTTLQPVDRWGIGVFTKTAVATDSQVNFSFSGSYVTGVILAYRGVASVDVTGTYTNGGVLSNATVPAPVVTTTTKNDMVIEAAAAASAPGVGIIAAPETSRVAAPGGGITSTAVAIAVSDQLQATVGQSAAQSFTFSRSSYKEAITIALSPQDTAPVATITSPTANAKIDPRLPLTVSWIYSDAEGSPQAGWRVAWKFPTVSTYGTALLSGTDAATSATLLPNMLPDVADIDLGVAVYDGIIWSDYFPVRIRSDSWTYLPEIIGASSSMAIDTTGFSSGSYQVEVATSDDIGYGPYSAPLGFSIVTTNVSTLNGSTWTARPRLILKSNGQWVQVNPTKI